MIHALKTTQHAGRQRIRQFSGFSNVVNVVQSPRHCFKRTDLADSPIYKCIDKNSESTGINYDLIAAYRPSIKELIHKMNLEFPDKI